MPAVRSPLINGSQTNPIRSSLDRRKNAKLYSGYARSEVVTSRRMCEHFPSLLGGEKIATVLSQDSTSNGAPRIMSVLGKERFDGLFALEERSDCCAAESKAVCADNFSAVTAASS
jgi:hypothetical protein